MFHHPLIFFESESSCVRGKVTVATNVTPPPPLRAGNVSSQLRGADLLSLLVSTLS